MATVEGGRPPTAGANEDEEAGPNDALLASGAKSLVGGVAKKSKAARVFVENVLALSKNGIPLIVAGLHVLSARLLYFHL